MGGGSREKPCFSLASGHVGHGRKSRTKTGVSIVGGFGVGKKPQKFDLVRVSNLAPPPSAPPNGKIPRRHKLSISVSPAFEKHVKLEG